MSPKKTDETATNLGTDLKDVITCKESNTSINDVNMGTVVVNALATKLTMDASFRKTFIHQST